MMWSTKTVPFAIKSTEPDGSQFSGFAACYNNIDAWRHILEPGCLSASLQDFIHKDGFIGGMNHNWDEPIGKPVEAKDGPEGLFITGTVVETQHGKDVRVLLKEGVVRKLSIGFYINEYKRLEDDKSVEEYWKDKGYAPTQEERKASRYGALLVTKGTLRETSPVMFPANGRADIVSVKSDDLTPLGAIQTLQSLCSQLNLISESTTLVDELRSKASSLLEEARATLDTLMTPIGDVPDPQDLMPLRLKAFEQTAKLQKLLAGVS